MDETKKFESTNKFAIKSILRFAEKYGKGKERENKFYF